MDRLEGIRLFLQIVETGSFSKAAASLGMTQPTATKQVAALESRLKTRLFHRNTRGVTPTEVGLLYYDKCRLALSDLEAADDLATLAQSQVNGTLRITAPVAFGQLVLAPLAVRFMEHHPQIRIDLDFDDRYANLIERRIDLAIRIGQLADSTLGAVYLSPRPRVLIASPDYLRRHGRPATLADLRADEALTYGSSPGDTLWHFTARDGSVHDLTMTGPMRSNSAFALLAGAQGGLGVAALPWYVVQQAVTAGDVEPILTDWTLHSHGIHAVFPSPRLVPGKVSRFVAWLREEFQSAWWAGGAVRSDPSESRGVGALDASSLGHARALG